MQGQCRRAWTQDVVRQQPPHEGRGGAVVRGLRGRDGGGEARAVVDDLRDAGGLAEFVRVGPRVAGLGVQFAAEHHQRRAGGGLEAGVRLPPRHARGDRDAGPPGPPAVRLVAGGPLQAGVGDERAGNSERCFRRRGGDLGERLAERPAVRHGSEQLRDEVREGRNVLGAFALRGPPVVVGLEADVAGDARRDRPAADERAAAPGVLDASPPVGGEQVRREGGLLGRRRRGRDKHRPRPADAQHERRRDRRKDDDPARPPRSRVRRVSERGPREERE